MKKLLILLTTAVMAASVLFPAAAYADVAGCMSLTASASASTVKKDDSFTITYSYSTTDDRIRGGNVVLDYNSEKLEADFSGISTGDDLSGFYTGANASKKTLNFISLTTANLPAEGTFTVTFKALGDCKSVSDTVSAHLTFGIGTSANKQTADASTVISFTHADNDLQETTVPAGCSKDGSVTVTCKTCSFVVSSETIPATGKHIWDDGTVTTEPKCETAGEKTYKCTNEGCTATKTEEIAALTHAWDEGEETVRATCGKEGERTFKCTREGCTATKTETIDKLEHTWIVNDDTDKDGWKVVKEASNEEPGSRERTCFECQTVEKEEIPVKKSEEETPESEKAPESEKVPGSGKTPEGGKKGTPTGDGNNPGVYVCVLAAACAAAAISTVVYKKKHN